MNTVDRLGIAAPVGTTGAGYQDARALTGGAIAEVGARVQAWAGTLSGTGTPSGSFMPDMAELARGGDVYGLRDLTGDIAARLGATPTEAGALLRAAEGLTREVAVQVHGLAGAGDDRQLEGVNAAIDQALAIDAPEGIDGAIARFEAASETLARQNG